MTKKVNGIYSDRLKAIRSFVDFNYDLRKPLASGQKAKINRYFEALDRINARGNKVYRSANKARVRTVQQAGRNGFEKLPGFKVGFYPTTKANPATLRFRNGQLKIQHRNFNEQVIFFDMAALAVDTDAEIERALNTANKKAKWFRIMAGEFNIAQPRTEPLVASFIKKLQNQYSAVDDTGKFANNNWRNWLLGVITLESRNQTELENFLRSESKEKIKRAKQRKNKKRKTERDNEKNSRN